MGQSAKAVLQFVLLMIVFVGIGLWIQEERNWPALAGLTLAAVAVCAVLYWASHREDLAPDILREEIGFYFERPGFCFAVVPVEVEDECVVHLFYQNRYANPCTARILLRHCTFLPKRAQNKLSPIAVQIDCAGAECGVMQIPWGIPKEYQGTTQTLDVGADVTYPNRRGKLLRFREGAPVGDTNFRRARFLLVGVSFNTPARCKLDLPMGVLESVPDVPSYLVKTLWRPDEKATTVGSDQYRGTVP